MTTKWEINRAVRVSGLPAPARLIMLTLSDIAEAGTAEIPERLTPSLRVLASETGLSTASVKRYLTVLEEAGWIIRIRPTIEQSRYEHIRTNYRLSIPVMAPGEPVLAQDEPGIAHTEPRHSSHRAKGMAHSEPLPYINDPSTIFDDHLAADAAETTSASTSSAKKKHATKQTAPTDPAANPDFMRWWKTYPNPQKRPRSYALWLSVTSRQIPADKLLEHTERFAEAWHASGQERRFCPHSTTWLGNEGWNDPLPAPERRTQPGNRLAGADSRNGETDWDDPRILEFT